MRSLKIRPEAELDIAEAYNWLQECRSGLGDDFLLCLESAFASIQRWPRFYPMVFKDFRKALMRRFPYEIYFIESSKRIEVFAVIHFRRHESSWQSRKDD